MHERLETASSMDEYSFCLLCTFLQLRLLDWICELESGTGSSQTSPELHVGSAACSWKYACTYTKLAQLD